MGPDLPTALLREMVEQRTEKVVLGKDPGRPYIGLEHMVSNSPDLSGGSPSDISVSVNSIFERDDILFGKLRPNLRKCVLAPFPGYCSTDIIVLRARGKTVPGFAAKVLQSRRVFDEAIKTAEGTKMPRTSWASLADLRVFCPSDMEQSRIVAILDAIDEAMRRTEQSIAKLEQMKQGLLHDLLTRGVDENGDLRLAPAEAPHLYKDSPLGRIPKGWEVAELGSLLAVVYRYPTYYGIKYVNEGIREVRGELIRADGTLNADASAYRCITPTTAARFPQVRLEAGDFVMTVRGTVGKVAQVPVWLAGSVITANLIRLGFDRNRTSVDWAGHYLLSSIFQDALDLGCSATTIKTIQVPALTSIRLRVPGKVEQESAARRIGELETRLRYESNYAEKLRTLKHGLLHDLLTGRVRVPLPAEVSA